MNTKNDGKKIQKMIEMNLIQTMKLINYLFI